MSKAFDFYLQMKEMAARDNEREKLTILHHYEEVMTDGYERMLWEYMRVAVMPRDSEPVPIEDVIYGIETEPLALNEQDSDALFILKLEWLKCTIICQSRRLSYEEVQEYTRELVSFGDLCEDYHRRLLIIMIVYEIYDGIGYSKQSTICTLWYLLSILQNKDKLPLDMYGVRLLYIFYDFLASYIDSLFSKDRSFLSDKADLLIVFLTIENVAEKLAACFSERFPLMDDESFIDDMLHTVEAALLPSRGSWAECIIMEAYYDYLESLENVDRARKDEIILALSKKARGMNCLYPEVRQTELLIFRCQGVEEAEKLLNKRRYNASIKWYLRKKAAERFNDKELLEKAVSKAEECIRRNDKDFYASRTIPEGKALLRPGKAGVYIKLMAILGDSSSGSLDSSLSEDV